MEIQDTFFENKRLTIAGYVKLAPYPDEVKRKAFEAIRRKAKGEVRSSIGYLIRFCKSFCQEHGLPINLELRNKYALELGINGTENDWVDLTHEEIALQEKKKEEEREKKPTTGWSSHYKPSDTLLTIKLSPEEVEKNVAKLEEDGFFKRISGVEPRIAFAKALVSGETFVRSQRELDLQAKKMDKHEADMKEFEKRKQDSMLLAKDRQEKIRDMKMTLFGIMKMSPEESGSTEEAIIGINSGTMQR